MTAKLKPCPNPKCGHRDHISFWHDDYWQVACVCGVNGPKGDSRDEARDAWNAMSEGQIKGRCETCAFYEDEYYLDESLSSEWCLSNCTSTTAQGYCDEWEAKS